MWRMQRRAGKKGSVVRDASKVKEAAASADPSLIRIISCIRSQFAEIDPRSVGTELSSKEREVAA